MYSLPILLVTLIPTADAAPAPRIAAPCIKDLRAAIEKSLPFLEKSSAAWRTDRKCVTCHQVPFTIWALNDAMARGFAVDSAKLDDLTGWAFEFCTTNKLGDQPTGGFHLTSVDMILSQGGMKPRADALKAYVLFESLFAKRQKPDGSWREGNQIRIDQREADEV